MITLGAIFGTTVMGRFSLLIARLEFLIYTAQGWGAQLAWWWQHPFLWWITHLFH